LNGDDLDNINLIEQQKGNENNINNNNNNNNNKISITEIKMNMIEEYDIILGNNIEIKSNKLIFEFTSESIHVGITTDTIVKIEFLTSDQFINLNN